MALSVRPGSRLLISTQWFPSWRRKQQEMQRSGLGMEGHAEKAKRRRRRRTKAQCDGVRKMLRKTRTQEKSEEEEARKIKDKGERRQNGARRRRKRTRKERGLTSSCALRRIRSSSSVQPSFLMFGSSWLCHRSRHCFPVPANGKAPGVSLFASVRGR
eukprot:11397-Rhodomonas_salina.1